MWRQKKRTTLGVWVRVPPEAVKTSNFAISSRITRFRLPASRGNLRSDDSTSFWECFSSSFISIEGMVEYATSPACVPEGETWKLFRTLSANVFCWSQSLSGTSLEESKANTMSTLCGQTIEKLKQWLINLWGSKTNPKNFLYAVSKNISFYETDGLAS